jgi:hypothetical protein
LKKILQNNLKTKTSLTSVTELLSITLSFFGIAAISYALATDLSMIRKSAFDFEVGPVIASIEFAENTVKIKSAALPLWEKVKQSEDLHAKDQIYTGKGSSTKLKFTDSSQISLGENSIIVIENNNNKASLNLVTGSLFGQAPGSSTKMEVFVGGSKLAVSKDAEYQIKRDTEGQTSIALLSGSATMVTEDEKEITIAPQQVATVSNGGAVETKKIPILLKSPKSHTHIYTEKSKDIVFNWTKGTGYNKYKFEIALDNLFTKIQKTGITTNPIYAMGNVSSGSFYWRVSAQKKGDDLWEKSPSRQLQVTIEEPANLKWPENNRFYSFPVSKKNKGVIAMMDWENSSATSSGILEVSAQPNFKSLLKQEEAEKGPIASPSLPAGSYYWRVKNKTNGGNWIYSKTRTIKVASIGLPTTPTLTQPGDTIERKIADKQKSLLIKFDWNPLPKTKSYEWQSSSDEDFDDEDETNSIITQSNTTQFKYKEAGEHYWRVRSIDPYGRDTKFSKPRLISIVRLPPVAEPPPVLVAAPPLSIIEAEDDDANILLKWKKTVQYEKRDYAIQIAADKAFKRIVENEETDKENYTASLGDGSYYWRTATITPGATTRKWSNVQKFEIKSRPRVAGLISPENGEEFEFLSNSMSLNVKWEKSASVKEYRIQLASNNSFDKILKEDLTLGNSASYNLGEGTYFFRIKSKGKNSIDSHWTAPRQFRIALAPLPERLSDISPDESLDFEFRKTIPVVKIEFDSEESSQYYQLQTADNSGFENSKITRLDNPKHKLTASLGKTFWRVRGLDALNRPGKWSDYSVISSKALGLTPMLEEPANEELVKRSYSSNEINFSWVPLKRIAYYEVQVAKDINFENMVTTEKTDDHEAEIELSQSGKYFWRIKAYDEHEKLALLSTPRRMTLKMESELESSGLNVDELYLEISSQPTLYDMAYASNGPSLSFSGQTLDSVGAEMGFAYAGVNFGLGMKQSTILIEKSTLAAIISDDQPELEIPFHETFLKASYLFSRGDFVIGPHVAVRQKVVPLLHRDSLTTIAIRETSLNLTEFGVSAKVPLLFGIHGALSSAVGTAASDDIVKSGSQFRTQFSLQRLYSWMYIEVSYQLGIDKINFVSDELELDEDLDLQYHQGKFAIGKKF